MELPYGVATVSPASKIIDVQPAGGLEGLRGLCIDNDPVALKGLVLLPETWGCGVLGHAGVAELIAGGGVASFTPELLLADYHLGGVAAPASMVSADGNDQVRAGLACTGQRDGFTGGGPRLESSVIRLASVADSQFETTFFPTYVCE